MNQNLTDFFTDRKAAWLKAKKLDALDAEAQAALQQEADERFSLTVWLPDAAKRAGQLFMASHPSKFSHPSAKTSSIIATNRGRNDGYLRTGNADYDLDVFGNAAAMDVHKFLSLKMDDGQTVLVHLEAETDGIKTALNIPNVSFDDLKKGFLAIKTSDAKVVTDGLVKQVYFPLPKQVNDVPQTYHLLSTLTPSGLLARMKRQLDGMRFGDATKAAKESRKKNELSATGYDDIFDLTVTAYGGTKPQNISAINSQNGGVAYLLLSTPPKLIKRDIQLPTDSFFKSSLRPWQFKVHFVELHRLMKHYANNKETRDAITKVLNVIIGQILEVALQIRASAELGWSEREHYQNLPLSQRIWLDNFYSADRTATDEWATGIGKRDKNHVNLREDDDMWLDEIIADCARWMVGAYKASLKKDAISLSDDELHAIEIMVDEAIATEKEFFK